VTIPSRPPVASGQITYFRDRSDDELSTLLGVVGLTAYLIGQYRTAGTAQQRQLAFTVVINLTTVLVAFGFGEAIVRLLASQTLAGPTLLDTLLLPRSWSHERTRYRDLLKQVPTPYWVPDEWLGWTVGPNRGGGMYSSSSEGIRSAAPNIRYADRQPRYRIATVGDSFTFALDVPFEASWPNRLEQQLGSTIQVLNFGVAAYGVDQAYLRYLRDVRPWHPDVVVLGFILPDLFRSLGVYSFVGHHHWAFPFAKPRLIVDAAGTLRPLNVPVPSPQEIFSVDAITDLPFIEYDPDFDRWSGGGVRTIIPIWSDSCCRAFAAHQRRVIARHGRPSRSIRRSSRPLPKSPRAKGRRPLSCIFGAVVTFQSPGARRRLPKSSHRADGA
jgi:hypothetical protein